MIDWEQQWVNHAPNFLNGYLLLEIANKTLRLKSGPGFGDHSHPTTKLVLKLMTPHVNNRNTFDVGCGSGILTVAAVALGAKHVWSIDIEPQAMEHTQQNVALNNYQDKVTVTPSLPKVNNPLALMNMIWSEQKQAWPQADEFITSGILNTQRDDYIKWIQEQGYTLRDELADDIWLAFHFSR